LERGRTVVSDEIQARKDHYLAIMHDHGTKSPAELVASVRETQTALLAAFSAVPESRVAQRPAPDEWSVQELAEHAVFTERLIGKIIHHASRSSVPPAEDLEGAGIGMMPKHDARPYAEIVADLRQKNADLLRAVEELPAEPDMEMKPPHPFFGPLNCKEWAGFQRVHDLDHIQHLEKILATVGAGG
jgi:hypothetical protein